MSRILFIGFGKIAYSLQLDKKFSNEYPIGTHFQAVKEISSLSLDSVLEPKSKARKEASSEGIKWVSNKISEIHDLNSVEIVSFLCTPDVDKLSILRELPNVKGVMLEKPLGLSLEDIQELNNYLVERNIVAQVNFLRRGDTYIRELASGGLEKLIGKPQAVQVLYGNGLRNNGIHMLDLTRMLCGKICDVKVIDSSGTHSKKIKDDKNPSCLLRTKDNLSISLLPLDFNHYRENSIDIWGEKGRLALSQESSYFQYWPMKSSRFGLGFYEIDWNNYESGKTNIGVALKGLYENLLLAVLGEEKLYSSLDSAIETEKLVNKIIKKSSK